MGKYGNYLPTPPKSFGSWLNLYKSLKISENTKRIAYFDDFNDNLDLINKKTIDVSVLCKYVMQECSQITDKIQILNQELTAENTRLLVEIEYLETVNKSLLTENIVLTSIKPKWWHKLFRKL